VTRRLIPALVLALTLGTAVSGAHSSLGARHGGIVRILLPGSEINSIDPALEYTIASYLVLDPTCARLLARPDAPLKGATLQPEVAAGYSVSADRRTYTFTLRSGFRFNNGKRVEASAFARAIDRTLAPGMQSPIASYTRDIVGAEEVLAGRRVRPRGVTAHGNALTIRLKRPVPDSPVRTGTLCAVPPNLPVDPEGIGAHAAAGPYYVADYRPNERIVIRRNPFYGGTRPHHVDGYDVDLSAASYEEVLDGIEAGKADWGYALPTFYFDAARALVKRYGVNRSQFFVQPGFALHGYVLNSSRPLFRDNVPLRRAVNFAIDRAGLRRAGGGPFESRLTDQYLPPAMPGFEDAHIYPLHSPDLQRARELARGHLRSGNALLYTVNTPVQLTFTQTIKQNLAKIGLDVTIKAFPKAAYFGRLAPRGDYDIGFMPWTGDYLDPSAYLNSLFDGRFIGVSNWARFDSPEFNRRLRNAALLQGAARYRAYGRLDAQLAQDAAPMVAVDVSNEPTLVSKRVGCVVLNPYPDLTAMCLR
jgi:peptide/nickel transport system substrate-binding protein